MQEHLSRISPLIKTLSEQMERAANHQLAKYDITFSQMRVLITLNGAPETTCSLKELERTIKVTQQTMAGIVCRLEKKSLVAGVADLQDRRVKNVRLTEQGRQLSDSLRQEMETIENQILSCLDGDERESLRILLLKVFENCK